MAMQKIKHFTDVVSKKVKFMRARELNQTVFFHFWRSMRLNIVTQGATQLSDGSAWEKCFKELGT